MNKPDDKTFEELLMENEELRENLIEVQNQFIKIQKSIEDSITQKQNEQIEKLSAMQCFKLAGKKMLAKKIFRLFL